MRFCVHCVFYIQNSPHAHPDCKAWHVHARGAPFWECTPGLRLNIFVARLAGAMKNTIWKVLAWQTQFSAIPLKSGLTNTQTMPILWNHATQTHVTRCDTKINTRGPVLISVTCLQQTIMSGQHPRFWPMRAILQRCLRRSSVAHARCHGKVTVNLTLMSWFTFKSFTTYLCILWKKNGQYMTWNEKSKLSHSKMWIIEQYLAWFTVQSLVAILTYFAWRSPMCAETSDICSAYHGSRLGARNTTVQ